MLFSLLKWNVGAKSDVVLQSGGDDHCLCNRRGPTGTDIRGREHLPRTQLVGA